MDFGAVFPQTEFVNDPAAITDYAQAVESMGYTHIAAYDHVLGANPDRPGGWHGIYTYQSSFQEPLILFAFMAAKTHNISFVSTILILPQRQTALVAKQTATLDNLSGGKFRLGIGVGWNAVEYEALNESFHSRGRRSEEQVQVLRQLWTQPLVTFKGRWHTITDAGLNPLPIQRPIPIYFGGQADQVLKRTARYGDGWLPNTRQPDECIPLLEKLDGFLADNGRKRSNIGIEVRITFGDGNPEVLKSTYEAWKALGVTQVDLNTMHSGFTKPDEHIQALNKFIQIVR